MSFKDLDPRIAKEYGRFSSAAAELGSKAVGVTLLPLQWTPPYLIIPVKCFQEWLNTDALNDGILEKICTWIREKALESVIVRSSGVNERIGERGKYLSIIVAPPLAKNDISSAILRIFEQAKGKDASETMALIIQEYIKPDVIGHLSNEIRLSPTRNQWKYETEIPALPMKGINSKFAVSPNPNAPIFCGGQIPHQTLRSLGRWVSENVGPRCHIEWLANKGQFFVVQLDIEWREQDHGTDPTDVKPISINATPNLDACDILNPFVIGAATEWKKLRNLSDFDFSDDKLGPKIYPIEAPKLLTETSSPEARSKLISEITELTANRVVVRTDCKSTTAPQFNLPRTDTVDAVQAVTWALDQIKELNERGVHSSDIAFLIHAFIPARASAWVYASPESPTVLVDALWGLPDGLQVLPVDSYEVHIPTSEIIQTRSTFKPRFLRELEDGRWVYEDVIRKKGRSKVLRKADIIEIAKRTHAISKQLADDAQIMWFCDIPLEYGLGRNLPWYRSREKLDQAPREAQRYKAFDVRNPLDLEKLPERQAMIRLAPDANLIRDDLFLQKVIDTALEKRIPVELQGSMLGHTYYRLSEAGVAVLLSNTPKYHRVRQRRTFGKIVRDYIPANILSGGESVAEAKLDKSDEKHGLAGKLTEELEEFLNANSDDEKLAELADLLEVIRGLANSVEIEWEKVETSAIHKKNKRGGFEQRRVLLETSLPLPKGPLDVVRMVKINELGLTEIVNGEYRIPLTQLLNSIGRAAYIVEDSQNGESYSLKIKGGRLIFKRESKPVSRDVKPQQGELFDLKA